MLDRGTAIVYRFCRGAMWRKRMSDNVTPPDAKLAAQVGLLVNAFGQRGIGIEVAYTPDGLLDFVCEKDAILVRDAYLDQVRNILPASAVDGDAGLINGVTLLRLGEPEITLAILDRVDAAFGAGVATPNHVLSVTAETPRPGSICPASEPEEVPVGAGPDPAVRDGDDGDGVLIYVADTGLLDDAAATHPWLAGVTGELDPLTAAPDGTPWIPPYAGHGTFVAGTARAMAPGSELFVANVFDRAGATLESDLIARMDAALNSGPDIISLSGGGNSRLDLPYLGFETFFRERLRHYKGVAFVAAAGNNSSRRPFWPAAFPETISVGALSGNWRRRADFSDFGGWVDLYAPGEWLVNAFATGTYRATEPPDAGQIRTFQGMARWSGTSFSTPMFSALIAARMTKTGQNAHQAANALKTKAQKNFIHGVGPVLLPDP
jgi:Subtilase family